MANKLVSLRLTGKLISEAQKVTRAEGFSSFQEFIKDAIRKAVREYQRRKDLAILRSLQGSAIDKGIKLASKKRLERTAKELTDKEQERLIKEFGLDDVTIH